MLSPEKPDPTPLRSAFWQGFREGWRTLLAPHQSFSRLAAALRRLLDIVFPSRESK